MKLAPDHPSPVIQRGFAQGLAGNYIAADKDFETALRMAPDLAIANAALAWLRATCPVASLRNDTQAETYAIRACILTRWDDPLSLSALAAAHAGASTGMPSDTTARPLRAGSVCGPP